MVPAGEVVAMFEVTFSYNVPKIKRKIKTEQYQATKKFTHLKTELANIKCCKL